jgi:hypothetical protein
LQEQSVITREVAVAGGVFAPGHLGELTQVVDFALVDAVLEETGTVQKRVRLLPSRVVVYFVLALALFERCSYRAVWGKLVASLDALCLVRPCVSALCRARRRVGAAPFQALFETLAGPVARPQTPGAFWRGLRMVAIDGTSVHLPDSEPIAAQHAKRKRKGEDVQFGYPLLRMLTLIECGTRAVLAAVFGPETTGETTYAQRLLDRVTRGMLVLLDTGFDGWPLLLQLRATGAEFLCRSGARRIPLMRVLDPVAGAMGLSKIARTPPAQVTEKPWKPAIPRVPVQPLAAVMNTPMSWVSATPPGVAVPTVVQETPSALHSPV